MLSVLPEHFLLLDHYKLKRSSRSPRLSDTSDGGLQVDDTPVSGPRALDPPVSDTVVSDPQIFPLFSGT